MAKVRLQDPKTGKFHWVEPSAMQPDGSTPASSTPSSPSNRAPRGSTPGAARPSKSTDEWDEFFEGDETVDREDL